MIIFKVPSLGRCTGISYACCLSLLFIASPSYAAEETYVSEGETVVASVRTRKRRGESDDDVKRRLASMCAAKFSSNTTLQNEFDEDICKPPPEGCTFSHSSDVEKCPADSEAGGDDETAGGNTQPTEMHNARRTGQGWTADCAQCVTGTCHYDCPEGTSEGLSFIDYY